VRRHLSAETLALHREGAVSASEAANIRAHLAACPGCSAIDAQLADVPGVLSAAQWPPMQQSVYARIQMAIASESAARGPAGLAPDAGVAPATGDDAGTRRAGEFVPAQIPGRPDLPERRRRRFPRFPRPNWSSPLLQRGLAAAGAIVVIVGAGMLFANARSSPSGAGSTAGAPAVPSPASRPTATGGQVAHRPAAGGQVRVNYQRHGQVSNTTAVVSDANFNKQSLLHEVRRKVASVPSMGNVGPGPQALSSASAASLPGAFGMPQLESCLNEVASGRMVLITMIARYLGTPAAIIVMRAASAHIFNVVVVGFACSVANPAIITTLTVPAP
jgi:hypothetical protein